MDYRERMNQSIKQLSDKLVPELAGEGEVTGPDLHDISLKGVYQQT